MHTQNHAPMIPEGEQRAKRPSPLRFVADAMLGRLAKWLRMMGYDVVYLRDTSDLEVLRRARAESRLILTRDTALAQRAGKQAVFIHSQSLKEQLRELTRLGLIDGPLTNSRCPICNVPLRRISKREAQKRVPPFVYQTQTEFYECPACGRVYWAGTHWQHVQDTWRELGWEEED